LLLEQYTTTFL